LLAEKDFGNPPLDRLRKVVWKQFNCRKAATFQLAGRIKEQAVRKAL
jgi:hypothetical protein